MKQIHFLSFFLVCCIAAKAQWTASTRLISGTDTARYVYQIRGYGANMYACSDKGLYRSTDNGASWTDMSYTKTNTAGRTIRAIYVNASGKIYIASDSAVFTSTDNGNSWSTTAALNTGTVTDIVKAGSNMLISYGALSAGGMFYSSNDLSSVSAATVPGNVAMSDFLVDGANLWCAGAEGVYKSTDNGATWTLAGTGHPTGGKYLAIAKSGSDLYAGDIYGKGLFKSSDNGATWANPAPGVFTGFCQVFSVVTVNGTIAVSVDGACNGSAAVKASTDAGGTWPAFMNGLPQAYYQNLGRNESGSCFFAFNNTQRTMYRMCGPSGIEQLQHASINVVPNPATDRIAIQPDARQMIRSVSIVNINGQMIYHSGNVPSVDISRYAPGLYFLTIETDGGAQRMKFVKE